MNLSLVVGYIRLIPAEVEKRTGLHFTWTSGDLGPMEALIAETISGQKFGLFRHKNAPIQEHTSIVIREPTENVTLALDDVLDSLGIETKEMISFHPQYHFADCRLVRQDDHGQKFEVGSFHARSDAVIAMRELESRMHKQTYWVEGPGGSFS